MSHLHRLYGKPWDWMVPRQVGQGRGEGGSVEPGEGARGGERERERALSLCGAPAPKEVKS